MISIGQCPTIPVTTPVYAFPGFGNPDNMYAQVTICDWDCCLLDDEIAVDDDSVDIPGYGTITQPTTATSVNCDDVCSGTATVDNTGCGGIDCHCHDDNGEPNPNWNGKVDGHFTYVAFNSCQAICVEATGYYADYVWDISYIADLIPAPDSIDVQNDQLAYVNVGAFDAARCGNSDQSKLFYVLGQPQPSGT